MPRLVCGVARGASGWCGLGVLGGGLHDGCPPRVNGSDEGRVRRRRRSSRFGIGLAVRMYSSTVASIISAHLPPQLPCRLNLTGGRGRDADTPWRPDGPPDESDASPRWSEHPNMSAISAWGSSSHHANRNTS